MTWADSLYCDRTQVYLCCSRTRCSSRSLPGQCPGSAVAILGEPRFRAICPVFSMACRPPRPPRHAAKPGQDTRSWGDDVMQHRLMSALIGVGLFLAPIAYAEN